MTFRDLIDIVKYNDLFLRLEWDGCDGYCLEVYEISAQPNGPGSFYTKKWSYLDHGACDAIMEQMQASAFTYRYIDGPVEILLKYKDFGLFKQESTEE